MKYIVTLKKVEKLLSTILPMF